MAIFISISLELRKHRHYKIEIKHDKLFQYFIYINNLFLMDRLTCMTIFVKTVELGLFSATANALNLSLLLVGKYIRLLETHLNVRLLNRTTKHQSLSKIGSIFYERAKNILIKVAEAQTIAAQSNVKPRGRLKISASTTFGTHALTPLLPEFLRTHPEVSIDLSLTYRKVDLIDEGYDLVLPVGKPSDCGLIVRSLAPYRLLLFAAPSYLKTASPLNTPNDLRQRECFVFSMVLQNHWEFIGPQGLISVPVSGCLISDGSDALLPAAISG